MLLCHLAALYKKVQLQNGVQRCLAGGSNNGTAGMTGSRGPQCDVLMTCYVCDSSPEILKVADGSWLTEEEEQQPNMRK